MPWGFFSKPDSINDGEGLKDADDENDEDQGRKGTNNRRLSVRKNNNGIIFLRKGRQIDVVDSHCKWTKFQNNDRYIGIEVDFSPELDEDFSITTSKQQIVLKDRIWDILRDNGVYEVLQNGRKT